MQLTQLKIMAKLSYPYILLNVQKLISCTDDNDNNNNNKVCIVINIKDNGTGIDSEIEPRLFTKFASTSESGLGLGLYISKSIVEAHGGTIRAQNNADGKGAQHLHLVYQ